MHASLAAACFRQSQMPYATQTLMWACPRLLLSSRQQSSCQMVGDANRLLAAQQWSASEALLVNAAVKLLHPLDRHLVWTLHNAWSSVDCI